MRRFTGEIDSKGQCWMSLLAGKKNIREVWFLRRNIWGRRKNPFCGHLFVLALQIESLRQGPFERVLHELKGEGRRRKLLARDFQYGPRVLSYCWNTFYSVLVVALGSPFATWVRTEPCERSLCIMPRPRSDTQTFTNNFAS